jgi:signal transduction histidine kinase
MSQTLKQYEELVIASDRKIFLKVRLRLTGVYMLIVACIMLGYNTLNYLDLRHDLAERQYYTKMDTELTDVPGHAETLEILIKNIIVNDIIILSIAAWISYIFAGYTLKPVQKSLLVQKNFSENASHELRTPLAVIKSDAEVLLRNQNPTEDAVKETLKSIIEEIDRMTVMTNDLLVLARSEHQEVSFQKSINIIDVVTKMIKKMDSLAYKGGVHLEFTTKKISCIVNGDEGALERVFLNLLQNAITHTKENGLVTVSLKKELHCVVITVKDTGVGIDPKNLPHVFERFYKGENAGGTGLGLPIVKEIIESHEGKISIKSSLGIGTEVAVRLPCIFSKPL